MPRCSGFVLLLALSACSRSNPSRAQASAEGARADSHRAANVRDTLPYGTGSLPRLVTEALFRSDFYRRYTIFAALNPYYQRGQFDGDTVLDVAVQIRETGSGKRGIAIIHGSDSTVHILGAGTPFGNGGDDFNWLWLWRVEPRNLRSDVTPVGREVLYVEKPEAAGGIIWWNGRAYVWTQSGD